MKMCKYLQAWTLPDINCYPTNMVNFQSRDQKSTVIIVSSTEQIFSLVVGKLDEAVTENSAEVPFAKFDLENKRSQIFEMKSAKSFAAIVTTGGKLMVYDSVENQLTCIDSLPHTRHVNQGAKTNHLFVVRQPEGTHPVLELVDAADAFSAWATVKSYELIADGIDSGAKFCIRTFTINETNGRFLGDFLGFSKMSNGEEVIVIAINNQLFWLQPRAEGDCDLITVRCFSSNVVAFEFCESSICLTVLLEAGVLAVFNQSFHPDTLLVSSSFIYLQAPIEAHGFDKANNSFLYSNGLTTHRVRYHFSEETKQLVTETEQISVYGVVAITLIENKELALLLTENGKFYTLVCTDSNRDAGNHSSAMVTLRKEMRAVAKRTTKILTDEVAFDRRLDQAIQSEQAHFNVLALHRNKIVFGNLCRMEITFHQEMPLSTPNTLLLEKQANQAPCLFARVKIEINLGFFVLLMEQRRWTVCIEYDETVAMYPVHDTFDTQGVLLATVFLCHSQFVHGLPKFRAFLFASVRHGDDNLLLTIPVPQSPSARDDNGSLVRKLPSGSTLAEHYSTRQAAFQQLVSQHNPQPGKGVESRHLTYCIQNEESKTKAISFSSALENLPSDTWSVLTIPVTLRWHSGKDALFLQTHHPVALDIVKRFLLLDDEYSAEMETRLDKLKGMCLELQAVSSPDLIITLYQQSRNNNLFVAGPL
uniref:Uncharacterized protein n=1 Tax=Anopheles atroparvus TaxID=41427 RepID=A0AAG5CV70_ANOAO